jgi:hypothetical protein
MSKSVFSGISATRLRDLLRAQQGRDHLDVESRGAQLTIFTVDDGEKVPLARLTLLSRGDYGLSLMWHTGRWERLPVVGTAAEVVEALTRDFADLLVSPTGEPP